MNNRSFSSTVLTNLHQENENLVLEPLLPSNQDIEQSTNGLLESEEQRDFQSVCFTYISRLRNLRSLMTARPSRQCCYDSLKWIPVIFILALVTWSYYAYVIQMCILTIDSVPKKVIYLCIYHPLLILFLWSYYRTMFQPTVGPPKEFYISDIEGQQIKSAQTIDERRAILVRISRQANLSLLTRHFDGSIRYCFVCQCIKPDRAHHCSICEKCVLRYDHHCPWTNSCVSYGNYKFFVLFLCWAWIFCAYVAATSLEYFIQFWKIVSTIEKNGDNTVPSSEKFHLFFVFFVSIMFGISISSLFFYHLYLTGKNRTTIESFRAPIFESGPQKEGFNLGWKRNFQEIFGTKFFKAIIPISTTRGDGVHYQVNSILLGGLQQPTTNPIRSNDNDNNIISPFIRSDADILPFE
ncbi:unnamed protein product [Adineta steineri]|uniref:Palmitoyltransferase n=1 Tax=Adineta steineri TaxID=433720 RepID=A0A818INM6_9BILA|nr:unnamed protein product [Adineta steineri]